MKTFHLKAIPSFRSGFRIIIFILCCQIILIFIFFRGDRVVRALMQSEPSFTAIRSYLLAPFFSQSIKKNLIFYAGISIHIRCFKLV